LTKDYDDKSAQTSSTAKTRSQTLGGSSRDLVNSSKDNNHHHHDEKHVSHTPESDRPTTPSKSDLKAK